MANAALGTNKPAPPPAPLFDFGQGLSAPEHRRIGSANSWEISPLIGAGFFDLFIRPQEKHAFLRLSRFGTLPATPLAWSPEWPVTGSGRYKMSNVSLTQLATSLLAALVTSTIFISAAVGPVGQFI
ncbi:MAG TPA: hypothetical protein VF662_11305 [Allosphingosinicella sp.]